MMYYSQHMPIQQQLFIGSEHQSQTHLQHFLPVAPPAVGMVPMSSGTTSMPQQQLQHGLGWQSQQVSHFVNPTLAAGYASPASYGSYGAPQPAVKRHNPYAPVPVPSQTAGSSSSAYRDDSTTGYDMMLASMGSDLYLNNGVESFENPMSGGPRFGGHNGGAQQQQHPISHEELLNHRGTLVELSRTAPGSSFIQAALREDTPYTHQNVSLISSELLPAAGTLLLDAHGCYVIKTLMERLPSEQLKSFVTDITGDQQLVFAMCIHSLHTRRVVQFIMDTVDVMPVAEVLVQRCQEVSMTQQGCIIMQRAMDITPEPLRAQLFSTIFDNLLEFSVDPFANYVVQHMLEIGDKDLCSQAVLRAFRGNIVRLACNKFASNVMEKSLFHITPEAQHDLIHEMYDVDEEVLHSMMQDSFGNYLIQSSIALATMKDVLYINDRLRSVLMRTPYGHKIELRIERRLKGRPVGTRSAQIGANSKSSRQHRVPSNRDVCAEPSEEPW